MCSRGINLQALARVQKTGFSYAHDPEVPHSSTANQLGLFTGPVVAKVATQYIAQLSELQSTGNLATVAVARKTVDGRSVIDRGMYPDDSNYLLAGISTTPLFPPRRCVPHHTTH